MSDPDVRIVKLEPMRVAAALGYGPSPEPEAWEKLLTWARAHGQLEGRPRFFGFNNPGPQPGTPNYGYEQWMTVTAAAAPEGDIKLKDFPGGLFAVARCRGTDNLPQAWQDLVTWQERSRYRMESDRCLEECLTPGAFDEQPVPFDRLEFDLYLPVVE